MIFRIIIVAIIFAMVVDFLDKSMKRKTSENFEEENISYQLIDEIASERERAKQLEDLISVLEAYKDAQADEDFNVSFTDPSGSYKFSVKYSDELLGYLYTERQKTRTELNKKIKSFSN